MLAEVEIVTGLAGAGKTDRLLFEYRSALEAAAATRRIPRLLWITPTLRSRELVRQKLFGETGLRGCFAPNIFTFDQFAEQILRHSTEPVRFLSETAKRLVVRSLIDQQLQQNQLTHFRRIAHTEGYLEIACQFISELKRDEIWPERFLETCHQHLSSRRKDCELGELYLAYQAFLNNPAGTTMRLYDTEGRFWSARDALERGEYGPFDRLDLLVVDGFTDFTFTQYGILNRLADRTARMLISLPLEEPLKRGDLFAKSVVARKALKTAARRSSVTHLRSQAETRAVPAAIEFIAQNLFQNPRRLESSRDATGLELIAAIGPASEAEYIAREVKQLLLDGVSASEIIVSYRSLKEDAAQLTEILTAAGVPFHCESSLSLTELPLTKALFSILQLEQEDWAYDRLMKLIDSNFFRPEWPSAQDSAPSGYLAPAIAISTVIRKARLGEGRFAILRKLNWLVSQEQERIDEDQDDRRRQLFREQLFLAADWLNRLSESTATLRRRHSFGEWIEQLIFIARDLGLQPSTAPKDSLPETDTSLFEERSQWDFIEKSLFDAIRFCEQFAVNRQKIGLTEFQSQLIHLLQRIRYPQRQRETGAVRILEASQVRNLEIDYLFLAGMTEGTFPQSRQEDCIYSEAERLQFHEWDIPLGHSATRTQEEMLLFYTIVTRVRKRLTLSYPSVSASGEPLFAAPGFQSVRELFTNEALPLKAVGSLDPIPNLESMFTTTDLRLVATEEVRHQHPQLFATLFTKPETTPAARTILATAQMSHARFSVYGFTPYEGMLLSSHNQRLLAEHFTPDYQFSTRQLEGYATCPFRFMYSELFKLQSLDPPEIRTDYRRRGILTHEILAALHRQYQAGEFDPLDEGDQLRDLFLELTREKIVHAPGVSDLEQVLIEVERELFEEWGNAFGTHWSDYGKQFKDAWDERPVPRFVELPFGEVPNDDGKFEVLYESVQFGAEQGNAAPVRVRGRIDRIDAGEFAGRPMYNVIDYKTGKVEKVKLDQIFAGRKLQLAIYTLAVRRLGLFGPDAVPFDLGYWLLNESGFVRGITKLQKVPGQGLIDQLNEILDELLPKLADEIRTGCFPVYNEDENCGQYCEFRTICRVGQIRSLPDSLGKFYQAGLDAPSDGDSQDTGESES